MTHYDVGQMYDKSIFVSFPRCIPLDNSGINKGLNALWKRVHGKDHPISATKIRKAIVTHVRKACPGSRSILAAHMSHRTTTADRYYNIAQNVGNAMPMARLISATMSTPSATATSPPALPAPSSPASDNGSSLLGEFTMSQFFFVFCLHLLVYKLSVKSFISSHSDVSGTNEPLVTLPEDQWNQPEEAEAETHGTIFTIAIIYIFINSHENGVLSHTSDALTAKKASYVSGTENEVQETDCLALRWSLQEENVRIYLISNEIS